MSAWRRLLRISPSRHPVRSLKASISHRASFGEVGGAFDTEEVRAVLCGVSRQEIDKRVQDASPLAIPGPHNCRSYPTPQFNRDATVVARQKRVRQELPTSNPWTMLNFLARLDGRSSIDVLRKGEVDLVVEAACRLGNQGA